MSLLIARKIEDKFQLLKMTDSIDKTFYKIQERHFGSLDYFFMKDLNGFIQGINSFGIKILSSSSGDVNINNKHRNVVIDRMLRKKKIRDAVSVLYRQRFVGNTLIAQGDRCYSVTITTKSTMFNKDNLDNDNDLDFDLGVYDGELNIKVTDISRKKISIITRYDYLDKTNLIDKNKTLYEVINRKRHIYEILRGKPDIDELIYRLKFSKKTQSNFNRDMDKLGIKQEKTSDIIGLSDNEIYYYPLRSRISTTTFRDYRNQFRFNYLRGK